MKANGIFRRIAAVIGWLLYCFGWFRIVAITPRQEPLTFALFFASAAIMLFVIVHSWIAHNKRLAAHGTRGNTTRYTPPSFVTDHLGRNLLLASEIATASDISLSIKDGCKVYVMTPRNEASADVREALVAAGEKE